jgi:hypothetical protein
MIRILAPVLPVSTNLMEAWVTFTWNHAKEHGWEPFVEYTYDSWGTPQEYVQKHGAMFHKRKWVYQGSISELEPNGMEMTKQDAVALSTQRWSYYKRTGTRPDLYAEFEEQYAKTHPLKSKL